MTAVARSPELARRASKAIQINVDFVAPTAQFATVASGPTPVNTVYLTFDEPVQRVTWSTLQLTRNGGENLLTAAQTAGAVDFVHWTIGNLAGLTNLPGNYQLTLPAGVPAGAELAGP